MKSENILLAVAFIAVFVSLLGAGFTYYTVNQYKNTWLTGFVTSGDVNVTVESAALLNFTTSSINWGSGQVTAGQDNATLNTCCGGSVTNGNWTTVTNGFVVENIGNVNVTLRLATGKTAATFIGGSAGGGPVYQYNVTNIEATSCINATGFNLSIFYDVNATAPGTLVCSNFKAMDSADTIRIDIRLVIPSDSLTGALSDTMTATFNQV